MRLLMPNTPKTRICYWNTNGSKSKGDFIQDFFKEQALDILCVAESKLKIQDTLPLPNVICDLREEERLDRNNQAYAHGGLLTTCKYGLQNDIQIIKEDSNKRWLMTKIQGILLVFGYFAPSIELSYLDEFWNELQVLTNHGNLPTIVMADFNARLGDVTGDSIKCTRGRNLLKLIERSNWEILHPDEGEKWTCYNRGGRGIPDHVIVSKNTIHRIEQYKIVKTQKSKSDHAALILTIVDNSSLNKKPSFERWNDQLLKKFEKAVTFSRFILGSRPRIAALLDDHWNAIRFGDQEITPMERQKIVDDIWDSFKDMYKQALYCSVGKFRFQDRMSWHSRFKMLEDLETEAKTAWSSFTEAYDQDLDMVVKETRYDAWKEVHSKKRRLWKKERKKLFIQQSDDMDKPANRSLYIKLMSMLKSRQSRSGCRLDPNKLQEHANYFKEKTFGIAPEGQLDEHEALELLNTDPDDIDIRRDLVLFDKPKVEEVIRRLANGKAAGIDGLKNEVIKTSLHILASQLTTFFNILQALNCIPSDWKTASIVPVFKNKGSPEDIKNYRPIALTCCFRRIYERLLLPRLEMFNKSLQKSQGGFRKRCSTYNQILALDQICKRNPRALHAFLDIKAAYDCVDRRLLWVRLARLDGISRETVQIFRCLFDYNSSVLLVKGQKSEPIANNRGLLQGSSLSPILFNYFIDDLIKQLETCPKIETNTVKTNNLFFADDAALHATTKEQLQTLLNVAERWSRKNGIEFAPTKCVVVTYHQVEVKLYDTVLPQEPYQKYLGIVFSEAGIEWDKTVEGNATKARKMTQWFHSKGVNINGWRPSCNRAVYQTFIRPMMEYGLGVDILPASAIKTLQDTQNFAFRKLLSVGHQTSISGMHKMLNLAPIQTRNQVLNAKYLTKLTKLTASELQDCTVITQMMKHSDHTSDTDPFKSIWHNPFWEKAESLTTTPEAKAVLKERKKMPSQGIVNKISIDAIKKMVKKKGDVGDVIPDPVDRKPNPLLSARFLAKQVQKNLIQWRLGRVAFHQSCTKCFNMNEHKEMSRQHAVECSGVREEILSKFSGLSDDQHTILDIALNKISLVESSLEDIQFLSKCIENIRQICLDWHYDEDGILVGPASST